MLFSDEIRKTLEYLGLRKRAYYYVFRSPTGAEVLKDLAKFCRATQAPWGATPEDTSRLVGRQEVWLRIMQHLNLSDEELYALYGGMFPLTQEAEHGSAR